MIKNMSSCIIFFLNFRRPSSKKRSFKKAKCNQICFWNKNFNLNWKIIFFLPTNNKLLAGNVFIQTWFDDVRCKLLVGQPAALISVHGSEQIHHPQLPLLLPLHVPLPPIVEELQLRSLLLYRCKKKLYCM